jgi:hypothetical protein
MRVDSMKIKQLAAICIILIIPFLNVGCFENDEKPIFDKNLELISAWGGITSEEDPISEPEIFKFLLLYEEDYQYISLSDDRSFVIKTGIDEGYPYLLCQFQYDNLSKSIQIIWEGYSSQPFISDKENKVDIYLYCPHESDWKHLYRRKWNGDATDLIVKHSVSKSISQYIDEQYNIYYLFLGSYGDGDSDGTLSTDFIELKGA